MSKEDDEDPMAFLAKMKGKIAGLTDEGETMHQLAQSTRERMDHIDSLLSEPVSVETGMSGPPPGLTGEEEVQWWNKRIADLSRDPEELIAESKSNSTAPKSSKDADERDFKGSK